jgi:hypothetical protein
LKAKYRAVFGQESRSNHKQFLVRRIAWRLQANAEGDLSERARQRAGALAEDAELRIRAPESFLRALSGPKCILGIKLAGGRRVESPPGWPRVPSRGRDTPNRLLMVSRLELNVAVSGRRVIAGTFRAFFEVILIRAHPVVFTGFGIVIILLIQPRVVERVPLSALVACVPLSSG